MARELECSVDYLINEAMKQYARQRSYGSRTPFPGPSSMQPEAPLRGGVPMGGRDAPMPPPSSRDDHRAPPPPVAMPMPAAQPPSAGMRGAAPLPPPPSRVPPPPAGRAPGGGLPLPPPPRGHALPAPPRGAVPRSAPPPPPGPPRSVPPPLPRGPTPMPHIPQAGAANGFPQAAPHGATLSVIYQGDRVPITKDRFVIGRGKQSSDLTLKDPNVSRQHAMIEFQNGVYFMVDMGSTNGVEYNGQRIARKQIGEGDIFKICDHDLVFTYR
jgi:hypothetical protein